jgi:hypothetical protein
MVRATSFRKTASHCSGSCSKLSRNRRAAPITKDRPMLLAIDQGNTNSVFAVHDGEHWVAH